jgi:hypothetical protein
MNEINLFLDLEETLIKDWFNHTLLPDKVENIKNFAKKNNIKKATMFSAAIWTESEKNLFEKNLKTFLEKNLELKLDVLLLEEAFDIVVKKNGIIAENSAFFCDIFLFSQKEEFFKQWLLASNKKGIFVLFDDTVEDSVFINKNLQIVMKKI